ncbi:phosphoethanolamine transferase [Rodentibacter myodis]|uniref:Protein DcaA n=1 Tax=Rodentibacter myodis TaxID=1907939 RepID=A0A1V3JTN6_9PAST|nr:sulfatase-like hydrolase/transferase [Rodentibacter myodis]OOF60067.1 protein DcaA [Rodentibacter myodis]
MRQLIITLLYSAILLVLEILYRKLFNIPSIEKYFESYLFIGLFVCLFLYSKYRVTRILIAVLFTISILVNNVHYALYQSWINPVSYALAFKELTEVKNAGITMVDQFIYPLLYGLIEVVFFLSLTLFKRKNYKYSWLFDFLFYISMMYVFVRAYTTKSHERFISPNTVYSRLKSNYFSFGYFVGRILPYDIFSLSDIPLYQKNKPNKIEKPRLKNIILIMGESASAGHFSVFGYERNTSPFLLSLKNTNNAVVGKAYSGGLLTAISLPMFFNNIPYPNGMQQIAKGDTNLFNLAKEQGFKTYFYSAQARDDMHMINFLGGAWVDKIRFPDDEGYSLRESMPDNKLLPEFERINLDEGYNFVVLHHRGSHIPYGALLDDTQKIFGKDNPIDNYDNTILNTDNFISQVYHYLSQRNKDDWLIAYTSDHGQYVKPNTYRQGTFNEDEYTVPLVLYSPNKEMQKTFFDTFSSCDMFFHHQLSGLLINTMGYDYPIPDCKSGVVNGNILTGDAGYLKIDADGKQEYIH